MSESLAQSLAQSLAVAIERLSDLRLAVVGASRDRGADWQGEELVGSINRWDPHLVLLTGGFVAKGSSAEWRDLKDRWTTLGDRIVAAPDRSARRRDKALENWRASGFGASVENLEGATWSQGTLTSDGVRWRIVVLDAEAKALGTGWLDQRTWLPRAVGSQDYDQLLLITNRPLASLAEPGPGGTKAVKDLLEAAAEHGDRTKLRGVISGGTRTNEVLLHSGSFGEVHLVAGNAAVPASDLLRRGESPLREVGDMALVDGFDAMLRRDWENRAGEPPVDRYSGDVLPVRGWWQVEVDGREIALAFQMDDGRGGYREVYRIRYTRSMGWVAGP